MQRRHYTLCSAKANNSVDLYTEYPRISFVKPYTQLALFRRYVRDRKCSVTNCVGSLMCPLNDNRLRGNSPHVYPQNELRRLVILSHMCSIPKHITSHICGCGLHTLDSSLAGCLETPPHFTALVFVYIESALREFAIYVFSLCYICFHLPHSRFGWWNWCVIVKHVRQLGGNRVTSFMMIESRSYESPKGFDFNLCMFGLWRWNTLPNAEIKLRMCFTSYFVKSNNGEKNVFVG